MPSNEAPVGRESKGAEKVKDENLTTVAGEVAISRQLLDHAQAVNQAYHDLLVFELTATPEQKRAKEAERRARLEAEWDAHPGMVGIRDVSDPECGPEYELSERGDYVSEWTTPKKWDRYLAARAALSEAENDL